MGSDEWWEYHLTPDGWVNGTGKLNSGHGKDVPVPKDRVLTRTKHETLSSPYARFKVYVTTDFESDDKELVRQLLEKYGNGPAED